MIEIVATAESVDQAKDLIAAGVDTLYIGNDEFGLRLPHSFSHEEMQQVIDLAHEADRKVCVAVNGLMHNEHIKEVVPYLEFLQEAGADSITVGDPGVIHLMKKHDIKVPYIYDGHTLVTNARQVNFWAKRGAIGAVMAREVPYLELKEISGQITVPVEILVYGATCIHHSKRPLVKNYFNYVDKEMPQHKGMFLAEPKNKDTHYSIFEDRNGTHIFATDDVNLLPHLPKLVDLGLNQWKLDGIFTRGERFVQIADIFVQAKQAFENNTITEEQLQKWNEQLLKLHPEERTLSDGFFSKDPKEVQ